LWNRSPDRSDPLGQFSKKKSPAVAGLNNSAKT